MCLNAKKLIKFQKQNKPSSSWNKRQSHENIISKLMQVQQLISDITNYLANNMKQTFCGTSDYGHQKPLRMVSLGDTEKPVPQKQFYKQIASSNP